MRTVEELTQELDDITKESLNKAQELSELLKKFNDIDPGEVTTDEDKENIRGFYASIDVRRQSVLRRLLIEWGGILFI